MRRFRLLWATSSGSTKMQQSRGLARSDCSPPSLWTLLQADRLAEQAICDAAGEIRLNALIDASSLGDEAASLRGRSVLIATREQRAAALALIELDGHARRLV